MKRFARLAALLLASGRARFGAGRSTQAPKVHGPAGGRTGQRPSRAARITVALEQNIRAGWHTYWINPGDVGAGHQHRLGVAGGLEGGRASNGPRPSACRSGRLWITAMKARSGCCSNVAVPADAKLGDTVTLKATAHCLVCKDICVPEDTTLTLPVKIGDGARRSRRGEGFRRRARRSAGGLALEAELCAGARRSIFTPPRPRWRRRIRWRRVSFPDKPGIDQRHARRRPWALAKDGLVLRLHARRQGHRPAARWTACWC